MSVTVRDYYPEYGSEYPAPVEDTQEPEQEIDEHRFNIEAYFNTVRAALNTVIEVGPDQLVEEKVQGMVDHFIAHWEALETANNADAVESMPPYYFVTLPGEHKQMHDSEAALLEEALTEHLQAFGVVSSVTRSSYNPENMRENARTVVSAGGRSFEITTQYMATMTPGHNQNSIEIGRFIGIPSPKA